MLLKILCHFCQHLLPRAFGVFQLVHDASDILRVRPRDQIILILELTVEGRGRIASVLRDILYGYFVDILILCQLDERLGEDLFCCFPFHSITTDPC